MFRSFVVGVAVSVTFQVSGCDGSAGPTGSPLLGAVAVATGPAHTCAVMDDGTAKCWGGDAFGQLGDDETTFMVPAPTPVLGLADVKGLALGLTHTCALETDGSVACWGGNTECQLGNGCDVFGVPGSQSGALDVPTPVGVPGISGPVAALATGSLEASDAGYTCALLVGGTMECWGSNLLGVNPDPMVDVIPPTAVAGVSNAVAMALGGNFACVLLVDSTVACWGTGPLGQPGANAASSSPTPIRVAGLSGVVAIAAGYFHVCALLDAGTVSCWGMNSTGALGDGTLTDSQGPVMADGVTGAVAIAAAGFYSFAVLSDGTVKQWGMDLRVLEPAVVPGLSNASSISATPSSACVVVAGGRVECWGDDSSGQLGTGVLGGGPSTTTPVTVVSGS
jgi:alpha-tubulin suppressor-like RCC1 family protein